MSNNWYEGQPVYTTRQSKAMTTGVDTVEITVPSSMEYILFWGRIHNGSGATINISVVIKDANGNTLATLADESVASGGEVELPRLEGTETLNTLGHGAYPIPIFAGQKIVITWGADAAKTGTSYWYLALKERIVA
ncbi:hypothetical protein DRO69_09810 [Candidatus Bathyarchaeota archaeon]|nr:MAG: hypothetical protein DRO69_09810 [Candidatus Bathyarchaeota archaeon]